MKFKEQIFISLAILLLSIFLYEVRGVLFPFIFAGVLAYFLNPVVDRIEKYFKSRLIATIVILVVFCVIWIVTLITVLPLIYKQMSFFISQIPGYKSFIQNRMIPYAQSSLLNLDPDIQLKLQGYVDNLTVKGMTLLMNFITGILSSSVGIVNILSLFFIIPMITFYLLLDWHYILDIISNWFPPKSRDAILTQLNLIDRALAGYIRGQIYVCLVLAIFFSSLLWLIDLDYYLMLGCLAGILFFIPYIGPLLGFASVAVVAYLQFGDVIHLFYAVLIFGVGQALEGAILTPKLVGDNIGLHPVWLIFSVFAGASLFGVTGVIIATPVAAVLGVICRLLISKYLTSSVFK